MRRLLWSLALPGLLVLAGCSAGDRSGRVTGKVTYKGQPLSGGRVSFVGEKAVAAAPLEEDGTYVIEKAPVGTVRIVVTGPPPVNLTPMQERGADGQTTTLKVSPTAKPPVKLPDHYGDPSTSRLTYEVRRGEQQYDIPLD